MLSIAQNDSFQTTKNGFLLVNQGQRLCYRDADVVGMRVDTQRQCDFLGDVNVIESVQLRVRHDAVAQDGWVTLSHEVGQFDEDRLSPLRERLLDDLCERADAALRRGDDVHGDGWTLSLIAFTDHRSGASCFPQQIAKVDWDGDELRLWHEDESEPFARYSRTAENTFLLDRLLRHFVDVTSTSGATEGGTGLGKRLGQFTTFHRHPLRVRRFTVQMSLLLAGLMLCMSLYTMGVGIVLTMVVVVAALPLLRGFSETLKHFERGLLWSSGNQEQLLLFDQIAGYAANWQTNGKGASGRVDMKFESASAGQPPIEMAINFDESNHPNVDAIQTHVSAIVADRMRCELAKHGRVAWTDRLSILRNGLEDRPTAAGPIRVFLYDDVERTERTGELLKIWIKGADTPILQPTNQVNFFPGLLLLNMQGLLIH